MLQFWIMIQKKVYHSLRSNLLIKMYNQMWNTKNINISSAPHWRLLEQYGGHLNILKFRENFNKVDYKYHGDTKKVPNFLPIGYLYEENPKFHD